MELDATFWILLLAIGGAVCLAVALLARRGSASSASLRPPSDTPALNKIEMIKRYREQYGVSLAEAKEAVEAQLAERKRGRK